MNLRKCARRRQSISRKAVAERWKAAVTRSQPGAVQWVYGMFGVVFLLLIACFQVQVYAYRASSDLLEDALAAGNLASAVVDVREYGRTHTLRIADPEAAYRIYLQALKTNLGLDDAMRGRNTSLISGEVKVERYIVYNVTGQEVRICEVTGGGSSERTGKLGSVTAPGGEVVRSTGVYSEISYPVKGWMHLEVTAHKGKLVEVVSEL